MAINGEAHVWQPKDIKAELVKMSSEIRDQYMASKDVAGLSSACIKQAQSLDMNEAQTRRLCEFVNAQVAMALEKSGAAGAYPVVSPDAVLKHTAKTASARPEPPVYVSAYRGVLEPREQYTKTASARAAINHREFGFDFDDSQEACSQQIKLASIEIPAPPPDEAQLRSVATRLSYKAADANRDYEHTLELLDDATRGYSRAIHALAYQQTEKRASVLDIVSQATALFPELGLRVSADVLDVLGVPCPDLSGVKTASLVLDHPVDPYIRACVSAYVNVVERRDAAAAALDTYASALDAANRATEVL